MKSNEGKEQISGLVIRKKIEKGEPLTEAEWDWMPEAWESYAVPPESRRKKEIHQPE